MKPLFYSLTALAAVTLAAPAFAQSESSGASTGAMQAPASQDNNMMSNASASGTSSDQYWGVDTAGVREDVKAPYGGHNQAQADRKEAPVTERLNEMQLQSNSQAQPR